MRGGSHIVTGAASAVIMADCYMMMHAEPAGSLVNNMSIFVSHFAMDSVLPVFLHIPLSILFYMIGTILPDVDNQYSMAGKIIYIPVKHRTWTHCWLPLLLCGIVGSIWFKPLFFLGIGMFIHMLFDSFSASGIYWFYPIKTKYFCKLYHTGQPSEYVFATIFVVISVMFSIFMLQHVYHISDIFLRFS